MVLSPCHGFRPVIECTHDPAAGAGRVGDKAGNRRKAQSPEARSRTDSRSRVRLIPLTTRRQQPSTMRRQTSSGYPLSGNRPARILWRRSSARLFVPGESTIMPTFVLTDTSRDLWIESFAAGDEALGLPEASGCSISKRRLRGGRREGVDLVDVNNGSLSFSIIPTRGMGIWRGACQGVRLGWDSPVRDGPVNPAFVNLISHGGLGWLDGFDELLARCGLENNGAPFEVKTRKPDGSESNTTFGLHGKIANIPASYVAVQVGERPPYEIVVQGHVEECRLFGPRIRMVTRISTTPGSNRLTVRD